MLFLSLCWSSYCYCEPFPSVWRFCGSDTVTSLTGTVRCTTDRQTLQLKLAPPPWMRSWARWSSSSLTRQEPLHRTSWCSASAPSTDGRTVWTWNQSLNKLSFGFGHISHRCYVQKESKHAVSFITLWKTIEDCTESFENLYPTSSKQRVNVTNKSCHPKLWQWHPFRNRI